MVYSPLIGELAIAMAYAILGKDDPLKWARYILEGYHEVLPLKEEETDLLYYLIAARWSVSVCHSARNYSLRPGKRILSSTRATHLEMIEKWLSISPIAASNAFRKTTDKELLTSVSASYALKKRRKHIIKALRTSYDSPVQMQSAAFQYMYDSSGAAYLDAYNNIPHVGHTHPKVVKAAQHQMALLNTNTRYLYDALPKYAEKLLSYFPPELNKVFFVNSGSEANDLAIRMAMKVTANRSLLVMEYGYHGITHMGIEVSSYKFDGKGGTGASNGITKLPMPDLLRNRQEIMLLKLYRSFVNKRLSLHLYVSLCWDAEGKCPCLWILTNDLSSYSKARWHLHS